MGAPRLCEEAVCPDVDRITGPGGAFRVDHGVVVHERGDGVECVVADPPLERDALTLARSLAAGALRPAAARRVAEVLWDARGATRPLPGVVRDDRPIDF